MCLLADIVSILDLFHSIITCDLSLGPVLFAVTHYTHRSVRNDMVD